MAIEYWLEMDCPVREQLGADRFKEMLKRRLIAIGMLEMFVQQGMPEAEALKQVWRRGRRSPAGVEIIEKFGIGALLEETRILDILVDHCKKCPANLAEGYGCYNLINYPISAYAEHWLAAVTKAAGERKDTANIPVRVIFDKKLKGAPFARMRRELGPRAFELSESPLISFDKGPFRGRSVRTDQMLDVMFLNAEIKGSFLQVLAQFSGGLVIQDKEPREGEFQMAFALVDIKGKEKWLVFNLYDEEADDQTTMQLKRFFHVVFRAAELEKTITVDI
jgi:hypothetical protein